VGGAKYVAPLFSAPSGIAVDGAVLTKIDSGLALEITFPPGPTDAYATRAVTLRFP